MAKSGRTVIFHGAFGTKTGARQKEGKFKSAFILSRKIRGDQRYIVVTEKKKARRTGRGKSALDILRKIGL